MSTRLLDDPQADYQAVELQEREDLDFDEETGRSEIDRITGIISALAVERDTTPAELNFLRGQLLDAAQAVALRSRHLNKMRAFALTDDLTGLYNRRGFLILGIQQLKLARRNDQPLLLLFADIDHFKQVNDTLGHLEGDAFLSCCADLLSKTFRDSDMIARLGGDEFVILAPEGPANGSEAILERLDSALRNLNGKTKSPIKLQLSVGVARFDPRNPETLGSLLAFADRKMFEQKRLRRQV